ncbi:MAG: hypothetical protein AB1646_18900 [Thermodesulfobacteriota bacterium]
MGPPRESAREKFCRLPYAQSRQPTDLVARHSLCREQCPIESLSSIIILEGSGKRVRESLWHGSARHLLGANQNSPGSQRDVNQTEYRVTAALTGRLRHCPGPGQGLLTVYERYGRLNDRIISLVSCATTVLRPSACKAGQLGVRPPAEGSDEATEWDPDTGLATHPSA